MHPTIIEKVKEHIKLHYNPEHCGYTEMRSEGNGNDVFQDGSDSGSAWALYTIGSMLGMKLEEPVEPEEEY